MKEIVIAFDIDGTILNNEGIPPQSPLELRATHGVNIEVIQLMHLLKKFTKNTRIIVWSGGGKSYAEEIIRRYGITHLVDQAFDKHDCDETVDIAFDDQHAFSLATHNIIVKMK